MLRLGMMLAAGLLATNEGDEFELQGKLVRVERVESIDEHVHVIRIGTATTQGGRVCVWEIHNEGRCVTRAKGCGLVGQAPLCEGR